MNRHPPAARITGLEPLTSTDHNPAEDPDRLVVRVYDIIKRPRYRIKKVGVYSGGPPMYYEYRASRRLPIPWPSLYVGLFTWTLAKDGRSVSYHRARFNSLAGAQQFISGQPGWFPRAPRLKNPDITFYDGKGKEVSRDE